MTSPRRSPSADSAASHTADPAGRAPDTVVVPPPRRRPRGAGVVERCLRRVRRDPGAADEVAGALSHLANPPVADAIRRDWVGPDYESLWRALARAAPRPVRVVCLELAAECRWGSR